MARDRELAGVPYRIVRDRTIERVSWADSMLKSLLEVKGAEQAWNFCETEHGVPHLPISGAIIGAPTVPYGGV